MKKNTFMLAVLAIAACTFFTSCDDEDKESRLPVFDKITLSPSSVAQPGDTLTATLHFSDPGKYVKGTYAYASSPMLVGVSGQFDCGSPKSSTTFKIIIPTQEESGDTPITGKTYTLTLSPIRMNAYAGYSPYIDPSDMGTVSTNFRIE